MSFPTLPGFGTRTPGADGFARDFGQTKTPLHQAGQALERRYQQIQNAGGSLFTPQVIQSIEAVQDTPAQTLLLPMISWMASSGGLPADQTYQVLKTVNEALDLTGKTRADGGLVKQPIPHAPRSMAAATGFDAVGTQLHQDAATLELRYQQLVGARDSAPDAATGISTVDTPFVSDDMAKRLAEDDSYQDQLKAMLAWMCGDLPPAFLRQLYGTMDDAAKYVRIMEKLNRPQSPDAPKFPLALQDITSLLEDLT